MVRAFSRWWIPLLGAALLLVSHWLLLLFVPSIGETTYWITVPVLEAFERAGLPTLRGSPEGWPLPTQFGLVFSFFGWYILYAAILFLLRAFQSLISRGPTPTI